MLNSTQRAGMARERDVGLLVVESDHVSFQDISRFLRRHFPIMASCFVLAIAIALFLIYSAQHKYTARAQILIDPNTTQLLREGSAGPDRSLDAAQVEGQIAVLRSESLAYSVLGRLNLVTDAEFQAPPQSFTQEVLGTVKNLVRMGEDSGVAEGETSETAKLRTALDVFLGNLDVRRVGMSYAIDIAYTSRNPNQAARIANDVADAYIQDQLKAMSRAARQSSEWLEERLSQLRAQLNDSARQLESFKAGRDFRAPGQRRDVETLLPPASNSQPGVASDVGAQDSRPKDQQRDTDLRNPAGAGGAITLAELESTTESYRKTYAAYQQAFTEAVQRQSFPVSNARVITAATRPLSKSSPRGRLMLAFAGLVGLLAGIAIALIRQNADHTVRSARQIKAEIGLPCLALVPRFSKMKLRTLTKSLSQRVWWLRQPNTRGLPNAGHNGRFSRASEYNFHIAIDLPFSPFSSALKTLRTAIAHADPRHPMRCVGVTSAMPREGKSMIAGNLATLYALSSGRTLIIDADIHNSTASRYFAPGVVTGLLEVVAGVAELDKAIVKGSGFVPDILPIAVRETAPVSYDQLASEKMQTLLGLLRERYDMVIVDLPPVNPIIDGVAIASLLDGVVIAAEWGKTPVELLAEVATTLHTAQANVLGVVLTKVDPSAATIRWRKDWGYGYYPMSGAGERRV